MELTAKEFEKRLKAHGSPEEAKKTLRYFKAGEGGYLFDKKRDILFRLARSKNMWERRTSIIATAYFMKQGETEDTLRIAEILLHDKEDLLHKATGWMLRVAGGTDLLQFLDAHAAVMPRTMLRYAIEKLDKKQREYYMGLKKDK